MKNGSTYLFGQLIMLSTGETLKFGSTVKLDANDYIAIIFMVKCRVTQGFSNGATWNTFMDF